MMDVENLRLPGSMSKPTRTNRNTNLQAGQVAGGGAETSQGADEGNAEDDRDDL
jgi:hypothetical protein